MRELEAVREARFQFFSRSRRKEGCWGLLRNSISFEPLPSPQVRWCPITTLRRAVGEMMTEAVVHVESTAPLTRVLQLMVSLKSRSFPVIGPDRQLAGMISREDVIRAIKEATQDFRDTR